jgi:menaquinol-cytochrome c reductase iron-sulfur subunit
MADDPDRRKFLKLATCGVGVGLGAAVGLPALSMVIDPAGKRTVTSPKEPIDIGEAGKVGVSWQRFDVIAPEIRDAWVSARNVVLGAAWVRKRPGGGAVEALSAVCPHLGCAVGWQEDKKTFLCACHDSVFSEAGAPQSGPAKRAMDPLPIQVGNDGRLRLTWTRYKLDVKDREPV